MGKNPLVTILLQSYNHVKYITECINSVYNQTFTDYELIVFDDGSNDGSVSIIEELANRYSFVYYHQQKNMGLVNTIIKMLPLIKGEYFLLLASDDVLPENKLDIQVNYMGNNPDCHISGGSALIIDESGSNKSYQGYLLDNSDQYDFDDLFSGRKRVCSPTLMIKTNLLDKLDIFNTDYQIEDLYMLLLITNNGYNIHMLKDVLCYYRKHKKNLHLNYSFIYHETKKILDQYKDHECYSMAKHHWEDGIFSSMAIYHKMAAIKIIPQVFNFRLRFFIRLLKLLIPSFIWGIIKSDDRD